MVSLFPCGAKKVQRGPARRHKVILGIPEEESQGWKETEKETEEKREKKKEKERERKRRREREREKDKKRQREKVRKTDRKKETEREKEREKERKRGRKTKRKGKIEIKGSPPRRVNARRRAEGAAPGAQRLLLFLFSPPFLLFLPHSGVGGGAGAGLGELGVGLS